VCPDHISEREQPQVETMKPTLQINVYKQPQAAKKLGKAGQETKGIPIPDPSTNVKEGTGQQNSGCQQHGYRR